MNTKRLLVVILLLAVVSTISSAASLFLVIQEKQEDSQLRKRVLSIESELATSYEKTQPEKTQPEMQQGAEAERLSSTLNLIFQKLSDHERSLERSTREISDQLTPRILAPEGVNGAN